jgi:nitroreductase
MNETMKCIFNRRSTRKFLPDQINEQALKLIIEAGLYAPSAHNQQPWHFTVIQNKALLDQLNEASKETAKSSEHKFIQQMANNDKFHIFFNAPVVIIVSGEEKALLPQVDCAAATENMLIAAESLGIGSCWIGLVLFAFRGEKGKAFIEALKIPEGYKPYYGVALGYKALESANVPARRENRVSYIF